ncbi:hypothetical protein ACSQ7D_00140 [Capnocytophaga sp. G1920]|jgi:hypothetical protein|uniref:hypothetical protein n=1 Tax=Capnocytophaga sp. G1920 TaxID=3448875 RepID=UPI003EDC7303
MSIDRALAEGLRAIGKRKTPTLAVEVLSVDKKQGTCVVKDEELEYTVRLASVINENAERFYLFPKIGSSVLISSIGEDENRYHVVGYSEIESVSLQIDELQLKVDKAGFHLQRGEVDFKSLLNELLNELKSAVIQTPAGPGNFAPNNVAKFEEINNKINELLQ